MLERDPDIASASLQGRSATRSAPKQGCSVAIHLVCASNQALIRTFHLQIKDFQRRTPLAGPCYATSSRQVLSCTGHQYLSTLAGMGTPAGAAPPLGVRLNAASGLALRHCISRSSTEADVGVWPPTTGRRPARGTDYATCELPNHPPKINTLGRQNESGGGGVGWSAAPRWSCPSRFRGRRRYQPH